ncbi:hypothetical protein OUZ56_007663 [Daphnia magna]|uniref:Uncharacterized protein n=1 Tax=Daphnia magna TaxID=35525 RepID=A0ABR0AB25_9CRUS|nr:hypothetical protein OUZ56_007663 [Daphnia magna]
MRKTLTLGDDVIAHMTTESINYLLKDVVIMGFASLFIWNVPFSCFWNATSQFPRLKASYHHSSVILLKAEK